MTIHQPYCPKVSIVVITYNSSKYVLETLQSVWDQTYHEIELIISDDCSTDNTVSVCKEWVEAHKDRFCDVKLVSTAKNSGIAPNCNRGMSACTGEWVKFIAGDDALGKEYVKENIAFANIHPEASFICSRVREYIETFEEHNAKPVADQRFRFNEPTVTCEEQFQILLRINPVSTPTVIIKKSLVDQAGGFDERYPFLEDRPLWLSIIGANNKLHYLDFVGVKYRVHPGSVQVNNFSNRFQSRFEIDRDNFFLDECTPHLPVVERVCMLIMLHRNRFIRRVFKNKFNLAIRLLSSGIGFIPARILNKYKERYT